MRRSHPPVSLVEVSLRELAGAGAALQTRPLREAKGLVRVDKHHLEASQAMRQRKTGQPAGQ
jgi:hypothetical protein